MVSLYNEVFERIKWISLKLLDQCIAHGKHRYHLFEAIFHLHHATEITLAKGINDSLNIKSIWHKD